MSILVVGSIALDTIRTPFGKTDNELGGSATYFSVSASFFSSVNLVAVIGKDFPVRHISFLKKRNIDLEGLVQKKDKTFRWIGEYDKCFSDAKTIATYLNVFAKFDPKIPARYQNSSYVFLANIDPVIQEKVLAQVKNPRLIACDTMNFWIQNKRRQLVKLLKKIDVFLINESEAKELTYEPNLLKAGKKIIKLGPKIIVIKRGEHGVLLFTPNNIFILPAFILESVIDPTGAGDTFAGGFMGYLTKTKVLNINSLRQAVVYGSIMASFAVEDFGLRCLGTVKLANIQKRLKQFKKYTSF
ncbi:MAG: sugar kinase [Candidatus Omnitrophica bacterium]|jgi:sugar/nucleoside kinase (ribokinase family)|nr:sugar kinase [Candidatus Omnitrophota bacterium]